MGNTIFGQVKHMSGILSRTLPRSRVEQRRDCTFVAQWNCFLLKPLAECHNDKFLRDEFDQFVDPTTARIWAELWKAVCKVPKGEVIVQEKVHHV